MKFATRQAGLRDSFVLFTDPHASENGNETFPRAGQISQIFLHGRRDNGQHILEPFFVIDEFQPLSEADAQHDPYRQYPDANTRLFYQKRRPASHLVRLQDIRSHFAALECDMPNISERCIVARPLDRVSLPNRMVEWMLIATVRTRSTAVLYVHAPSCRDILPTSEYTG